jgi:Glycosyltransferase family 87
VKLSDALFTFCNSSLGKIIFASVILLYCAIESTLGRNDLDIFLAASRDLFNHENIYTNTYFDGYHYYYSTLFATLIRPLYELPGWASKFLWLLFNVTFLAAALRRILQYFESPWFNEKLRFILGAIIFLFCLRFMRGNLHLGQVTAWMLYLSLESVHQIKKGNNFRGALLLAFAINIKLLPLVVIPYLLYRASYLAVIYALGLLTLFYFLPALWLGWDHQCFLLNEYFALINPIQSRHVLDIEETSFHSLTTLFATLFVSDAHEHNGLLLKRNIANVSPEHLSMLINAARMIFVVSTLWFVNSKPFRTFSNNQQTIYELSYLLLVVPLIFPHQQHYAFLMAMPAVAWVVYFSMAPGISKTRKLVFQALLACVYVSFNASLLIGSLSGWLNHFKILTWGAILLVVLLWISNPRYLPKSKC